MAITELQKEFLRERRNLQKRLDRYTDRMGMERIRFSEYDVETVTEKDINYLKQIRYRKGGIDNDFIWDYVHQGEINLESIRKREKLRDPTKIDFARQELYTICDLLTEHFYTLGTTLSSILMKEASELGAEGPLMIVEGFNAVGGADKFAELCKLYGSEAPYIMNEEILDYIYKSGIDVYSKLGDFDLSHEYDTYREENKRRKKAKEDLSRARKKYGAKGYTYTGTDFERRKF